MRRRDVAARFSAASECSDDAQQGAQRSAGRSTQRRAQGDAQGAGRCAGRRALNRVVRRLFSTRRDGRASSGRVSRPACTISRRASCCRSVCIDSKIRHLEESIIGHPPPIPPICCRHPPGPSPPNKSLPPHQIRGAVSRTPLPASATRRSGHARLSGAMAGRHGCCCLQTAACLAWSQLRPICPMYRPSEWQAG
jgi:hypothetical protein